ncbi:MAG TPA: uroporphyrinogen decarboxylase family protein [Anaerolineae bacterium]|nr:uroporphyrinogen decarboxylase family protein [Anaerolineae bacterium]
MPAEMTPRQRMLAALSHQEPDRVPLDIGGGNSTSLLVETFENLKDHLGISSTTRIANKAFRIAALDEETMVRLGSDVRPIGLGAPANWKPPPSAPGTFVDVWGITWRRADYPGGYYWELSEHPLAQATISDLDSYRWPDPDDPGWYQGLEEKVRNLHDNTPYALLGDFGFKGFWETGYFIRGLEQSLLDLVANQPFWLAFMDRMLELNCAFAERFLAITGPYLTALRIADDLATQRGPLMSPKTYRAMIKPYQKRLNEVIKQHTDATIFYHSCGNITSLLGDLVEAGFEAINPVQVSAIPDVAALKSEYGEKLSFWGAIDTQHVLPHGTEAEVREEVRLRIQQLGEGGGYIAAGVHNLNPDIPPQNIVAMSEAVRKYGRYPLQ